MTDKTPFFQHLTDTGASGGETNANGDYSLAEEIFYIQPEAGWIYGIKDMHIAVYDTNGMAAEEYGNLGAALTNGVQIRKSNDTGVLIDVLDGDPIKYNAQYAAHDFYADKKTWGLVTSY